MTRATLNNEGTLTPDNLIAGDYPKATETATITGGDYTKGSILGKITASGKYTICEKSATDGSETPSAILAEDVNASSEDLQAVIYLTGEFNSEALTAGTGNTVAGLSDDLRDKSIFIKTNQSA